MSASFNLAIDRFMQEVVPEQVAITQRLITLQALQGVVLRTPVDTGRARSNWQVSLEAPVLDLLAAYSPGAKLGIDETSNASAAITAAAELVKAIKPFSISYVQNNLPYIEALESGHSGQAPAGMVAVTVASIEAQFQ